MTLTKKEMSELRTLRNRLAHGIKLSKLQKSKMIRLLLKSGEENKIELENYAARLGYDNWKKFEKEAKKDNDLMEGLAMIGGAILIGYIFKELFKK